MDRVRDEPLMSLKNPQWGRRPGRGNDGPPDIEKFWRELRRKVEALFGGHGGGNGAGPGAHGPRRYSFYRSLDAYKESFKDNSDVLALEPDSDFFKHMRSRGSRSAT